MAKVVSVEFKIDRASQLYIVKLDEPAAGDEKFGFSSPFINISWDDDSVTVDEQVLTPNKGVESFVGRATGRILFHEHKLTIDGVTGQAPNTAFSNYEEAQASEARAAGQSIRGFNLVDPIYVDGFVSSERSAGGTRSGVTTTTVDGSDYSLSADRDTEDALNETNDRTVTITITSDNLDAVTEVPYIITGVTSSDINVPLEGTFNLTSVLDRRGRTPVLLRDTLTITVAEDVQTEGQERFQISLIDEPEVNLRFYISDTSRQGVGASLSFKKDEIRTEYFDNGNFNITVTDSAGAYENGDTLDYFIHGPAQQYITPTNGSFTFSSGEATVEFTKNVPAGSPIGDLYFELQVANQASVLEFPIFRERAPVSYELTTSDAAVGAGDAFTVTLYTTGYDSGDTIPWSVISGANNLSAGGTSGTFTLDANGKATTTFTIDGTPDDEIFRFRLDNGQASVKVSIRDNTEVDLSVATLNFPNLGSGIEQDQESGFQAIIEELANLRKIPTPTALATVSSSLDQINNTLVQSTTRNTAILQSIADQLKDLREDIGKVSEAATTDGIRTSEPYGDMFLAAGFKSLILEGGILTKDNATKSDEDVRAMLKVNESKLDQELKGESLKYLRNIIIQAKDALGDLE